MGWNQIGIAATPIFGLIGLLNAPVSRAQPEDDPTRSFEVASIRPTDPGFSGGGFQTPGNRVIMRGWSLKRLIQYAYGPGFPGLHPSLISGAPSWYDRDRFDIEAKAEGSDPPSEDERKLMLRALLAERFNLKLHRESKENAVYIIAVGKGGPKMMERKPDDNTPHSILNQRAQTGLQLTGQNTSLAELFSFLQALLSRSDQYARPLLDGTGLTGRFDFEVTYLPDRIQSGGLGAAAPGGLGDPPDLVTAVQEQLGLKLESKKVPMEALVIDHAEKPSEN